MLQFQHFIIIIIRVEQCWLFSRLKQAGLPLLSLSPCLIYGRMVLTIPMLTSLLPQYELLIPSRSPGTLQSFFSKGIQYYRALDIITPCYRPQGQSSV